MPLVAQFTSFYAMYGLTNCSSQDSVSDHESSGVPFNQQKMQSKLL